ncbi:MAG: asparagine synthase (glutamine-hydrolyzing), partial [Micromonosporaceae bacterium]
MCGLLTFVSANGAAASRQPAIAEALESLHHRGPDETGVVTLEGSPDDVVLGFKRLSIIDVEHSHQPMRYADDRYTMTFNGEIYNYIE